MNEKYLTGLTDVIGKCLNLNNSKMIFKDILTITKSQFEASESCIMDKIFSECSENVRDVILSLTKILKQNLNDEKFEGFQRKSRRLHRYVRDLAMSDKMFRIENHVKNACIQNGEPTKKLEDTLDQMKACMKEKQMFLVPKRIYIEHLDHCTKDAITLFKSCLPTKYKYLPKLLFDIIDSMVSFLYDDFTIVSSELTPCLPKLQGVNSTSEYNKCVEKIVVDGEDELVDSKSKFCDRFIPLNKCFIQQVHEQCKSSPELARFETDFINAVRKPCETK